MVIRKENGMNSLGNFPIALIFACLLVLFGQAVCRATTVVLEWDAVTEATGYKVYYQADSSTLPFSGIGATQGSAPVDVNNQTTATLSGLDPSHPYYFAVTAYNASGESAYSNIVSVPELVSPTVSLTSPTNNTIASGTVSVTADASDNVGVTEVEFYVDGALQATDTSSPYVYSWNTATLSPGNYTLLAKAYDAAGNVGQSPNVTVTVFNDTTPPTVSITAPANNATVGGTVAVTVDASDNVRVTKVEFYENGVLLTATNVSPYSYNWNTASLTNGSYTLSAMAYDAAGYVGSSAAVTVTVSNSLPDTTAPSVTNFSLPSAVTSLTVPITSFTATDNVAVMGYMVTASSTTPAVSATGWSASPPTTFTFATDTEGAKTAYAWAKDAAGNVSSSLSASVTITLPDTTSPTVSITAPANGAKLGGTVSVTVSASDNLRVTKVEFYVNGSLKATDTSAPYTFRWNTKGLAKGSYTLTAKAYDAANIVGSNSITVYK